MSGPLAVPYPPFLDPVVPTSQQVQYTYWPVAYQLGNATVISNAPLPLSGVRYSQVMRGVGELKATLQLVDEEVRALYPWDKIIPRKTGIVVVRSARPDSASPWVHAAVWHGVVWAAPSDPLTGRMSITAHTVEALWAKRVITKSMTWTGADQTTIAADLLDPAEFSLIPLGVGLWPGWITVDPPTVMTGVPRDFSYDERQETNLLEAHRARSQLQNNSYEWTTQARVLVGDDAVSASSFRLEFLMGFPKLGRQFGEDYPVPRFQFDTGGSGNVLSFGEVRDGSDVPNIVWGRGTGYEDLQVKVQIDNEDINGFKEWEHGYLQTEARFSDPDVKRESTLADYCYRYMWERLGSERFLSTLVVRGDIEPYFGTYLMGDEVVLETNDLTWPPDWYSDGYVQLAARIYGWTVTPPQSGESEQVDLLISGGEVQT